MTDPKNGKDGRLSGVYGSAIGLAAWTVAAPFLALALFVVARMPYTSWDALAFGEWSRLIARTGHFHFDILTPSLANRPLFYVVQGWIWRLLGYDEAYGRAFSLLFGLLLIGSIALLAIRARKDDLNRVRIALAVAVLLSIPSVAVGFCAGLTDVPAAALLAACAAALAMLPEEAPRFLLVAALAAAALLSKPTALTGLAGLGAACLVGPVSRIGRRIVHGALPLATGTGLALVYELREARHFRLGVMTFVVGPEGSYYAELASSVRFGVFWSFDWLGAPLRVILVYALAFAVLRSVGQRQRLASSLSLVAAAVLGFAGPGIGARAASLAGFVEEFRKGGVAPVAAFLLLLSLLWLAGREPADGPDRVQLARLLVWALPPAAAWIWRAGYDARLLSPAWPALVLLAAVSAAPALGPSGRCRGVATALAAAALLLTGLSNLRFFDGIDDGAGLHAWPGVIGAIRSGRTSPASLRRAMLGEFEDVRGILSARAAPADRIFSSDGRLRFFFPGQVRQQYPSGCGSLKGFRFFVLPTDPASRSYLERETGASGAPAVWDACRNPRLERLSTLRGNVVYQVGK